MIWHGIFTAIKTTSACPSAPQQANNTECAVKAARPCHENQVICESNNPPESCHEENETPSSNNEGVADESCSCRL